jgi:purine-nucleoside phosphorylase
MPDLTLRLALTKNYLAKHNKLRPKAAIVLGSGMGAVAGMVETQTSIAYKDIPNFPSTSVAGHKGRMVFGCTNGGTPLVIFEGRSHYYEGHSLTQVAYPAYVAHALGASAFIATNAAGGIDAAFAPGDLMLVRDHLNLMGDNPLRGPETRASEPRFPAMRDAYDPQLLDLALRVARESGIRLHLGVYAAMSGPSYETDAELHMLHELGADAVGMSTVPEVIAARALGLRVMALSVIANDAMPRRRRPPADVDHAGVLRMVEHAARDVRTLLEGVVAGFDM